MRVRGVGPRPCLHMICGEAPGYWESKSGRPFVGKTGEELDRLLEANNLPPRDEWFLTNVYREFVDKDYEYTAADLERDEPELLQELEAVRPEFVLTLGRAATRWFLGDVDMDGTHGIPWLHEGRVIFPAFHPAAGMHNSDLAGYVVADFQALAAYSRGDVPPRLLYDDPYPEPHYEEITSVQRLDEVFRDIDFGATVAIDTEGWPEHPWSLQFSAHPGTGYLIRSTHADLLGRVCDHLRRSESRLVFHAALHDLGMGRVLGADFQGYDFDDTAVMAYLLQLEPRGLKDGALRHCGMKMQSYTDLMGDVENEQAREYLMWLWENEHYDHEARQREILEAKQQAGSRAKKLPNIPKTPLFKAVERCLRSDHPARLWRDQYEDVRGEGSYRLGALPGATLDYVEPERAVAYGCRDADATLRLLPEYRRRIVDLGLQEVYALELSTYPLIDRMQQIGLRPDLAHFAALSARLHGELQGLATRLRESTGIGTFNANSGDQVAAFLFDALGLEEIKATRGGRGSTNDKILEALEREHPEFPVISDIRTYRELFKLKSTFVDAIPGYVNRWPYDGRVHATFRTTVVVTGRLSAADPNVLAQPEHGKLAKDFKRGWVADEGHVLAAWDQSQLELRVLAHLSQDPFLMRAFREGIDLHAALAQRIFGVAAKDQDKHHHRYPAKTIHYLMCMGGTAHGLMIQLRANGMQVDEDTAQRWMDETFALYAGVPVYMQHQVEEAERNGFIRSHLGRIRYIGGIRSRDERIRSEAARFAVSTPLQAGAQDLMKQSEARVWNEVLPHFWKQKVYCEPLLQQHDSLKFEVARGWQQELHTYMRDVMTNVPRGLSVPLATEGEWGINFAEMEAFT